MGWGFKIDYAKAIAEDERWISWLSSPAAQKLYPALDEIRAPGTTPEHWDVFAICFIRPDLAPALGLSNGDLANLLATIDDISDENFTKAAALWGESGTYRAGRDVWTRISADGFQKWEEWSPGFKGEAERKAALSKYKTSLARHKRNADKYGGR